MLRIRGLAEWRERLERVRADLVMAAALAAEAEGVAEAVRAGLSEGPGGGHERPWARSGALRESIGVSAEGLRAAVGSSDPAAVPQEMGTRASPARPFLGPVVVERGEGVAKGIGAAVAAALRGEDWDGPPAEPSGFQLVQDDRGPVTPGGLRALRQLQGRAGGEGRVVDRALTASDLGEVRVSEFRAQLTVRGQQAKIYVDMIRVPDKNSNLFRILIRLKEIAKAEGATSLTLEGSVANEDLLPILRRGLGAVTVGGKEVMEIPLY